MVIHILSDGSVVDDISGRIIQVEDARPIYDLIDRIGREGSESNTRYTYEKSNY